MTEEQKTMLARLVSIRETKQGAFDNLGAKNTVGMTLEQKLKSSIAYETARLEMYEADAMLDAYRNAIIEAAKIAATRG